MTNAREFEHVSGAAMAEKDDVSAPAASAAVMVCGTCPHRVGDWCEEPGQRPQPIVPGDFTCGVSRNLASARAEQDAAASDVLAIFRGPLDPDILEQTATMLENGYPHTAKYLRETAEKVRPVVARLEAAMEGGGT